MNCSQAEKIRSAHNVISVSELNLIWLHLNLYKWIKLLQHHVIPSCSKFVVTCVLMPDFSSIPSRKIRLRGEVAETWRRAVGVHGRGRYQRPPETRVSGSIMLTKAWSPKTAATERPPELLFLPPLPAPSICWPPSCLPPNPPEKTPSPPQPVAVLEGRNSTSPRPDLPPSSSCNYGKR